MLDANNAQDWTTRAKLYMRSNSDFGGAGDPLAIVEAMKMENILRAERDALIKKIHVKNGDSLAVDTVIMEFA